MVSAVFGQNRGNQIGDDPHSPSTRLEYEVVENKNERFRAQLAATNQRIDASNELVEYVEEERLIARQRAQAGVLTRMKWWLADMPDESDD